MLFNFITQPDVVFLLMTLGTYGLIFEMAHPGVFFPGVLGAIALLLGFYGLHILPVNIAGIGLLLVGIAFMTGEAFVPSFGALGIGGAAAFAFGAAFMFKDGLMVNPVLIALVTAVSLAVLCILLAVAVRAQKEKVVTGKEELASATGTIVSWSGNAGTVRITGEIWQAQAGGDYILSPGDKVRVSGIDGLKLTIHPV